MKAVLIRRGERFSTRFHDDARLYEELLAELTRRAEIESVVSALPGCGCLAPERQAFSDLLVVSMARSGAVLDLLEVLELGGATVVNSPGSVRRARNRAYSAMYLAAEGFDIPRTHVLAPPITDAVGTPHCFKVLYDGDWSTGLSPWQEDAEGDAPSVYAWGIRQRLVATNTEFKVHVIGDTSWVSGRSPDGPQERDVAQVGCTVARTMGLLFASVDILVEGQNYYVIDVNDFPSFSAVPDAAARVIDAAVAQLEERRPPDPWPDGDDR